ncbi:unnamed protein product [Acanthoscelides obtectus]|uniref:Zinc finger PHD-type domain-containing protein n=1 Tax=Acanthoscelides obtectus TaxID=200917 RepID=A0A9P0PG31_ACAOB|nr:unnamed protein product [Acanthoscelides obtectus]CAK1641674.1 hypothetical protein AOBTE_LOCUS12552 [Acanthoscelides obtectus]
MNNKTPEKNAISKHNNDKNEEIPHSTTDQNDSILNSTSVKPSDIISFPKAKHAQVRRKNSKKSEILTSTPYKDILTEKLESQQNSVKKNVFGKKRKAPEDRPKENIEQKLPASKKLSGSVDDVACPLCSEHYSTSEWIRCGSCSTWWHEDCSEYSGSGEFVCDFCT